MEVAVVEGLTIGTWANFDIDDSDDGTVDGGNFSEIDLYMSYDVPISEDCPFGASLGYTEYTYPRSTADADREVSIVGSLDTMLSPSLGVYYGVDGAINSDLYVEAAVGHEIEVTESKTLALGAMLAYSDPDQGEDGFSHASLSSGLSCGPITLSVAWIIETDDDVLDVDEEVVGTLGFGWDI